MSLVCYFVPTLVAEIAILSAISSTSTCGKLHGDCLRKELSGRGYTEDDITVLPYCVKHDWPYPFTSLGSCISNYARLKGAMRKK
ncbi:MAG: hypothetical protein WA005_12160 [Candidatus Binataceae bacterium]